MTALEALLLLAAGLAAGFINVVAGGGSLLTLPALIFLGLPPSVANGTNRVAILAQNIVAVAKFRQEGFRDLKLGLKLSIPAIIGAVIGARFAVTFDEERFKQILAAVMLLVLIALVRKTKKKTKDKGPEEEDPRTEPPAHLYLQLPLMFVIGLYGGFIQAGVGYLVILSLSTIGGLSLVRTNSLKVVIIGAYMLPSLLVFLFSGKIAWLPALVLTAGNSVGGWLGSSFTVKKGDRWIRLVLVVAMLVMVAKLLGLFG